MARTQPDRAQATSSSTVFTRTKAAEAKLTGGMFAVRLALTTSRARLRANGGVDRAWLARRCVSCLTEHPTATPSNTTPAATKRPAATSTGRAVAERARARDGRSRDDPPTPSPTTTAAGRSSTSALASLGPAAYSPEPLYRLPDSFLRRRARGARAQAASSAIRTAAAARAAARSRSAPRRAWAPGAAAPRRRRRLWTSAAAAVAARPSRRGEAHGGARLPRRVPRRGRAQRRAVLVGAKAASRAASSWPKKCASRPPVPGPHSSNPTRHRRAPRRRVVRLRRSRRRGRTAVAAPRAARCARHGGHADGDRRDAPRPDAADLQLAARVARPQHDSRSAHVASALALDGVEAGTHRRLPQRRRAFIYGSVAPDADGQQGIVVSVCESASLAGERAGVHGALAVPSRRHVARRRRRGVLRGGTSSSRRRTIFGAPAVGAAGLRTQRPETSFCSTGELMREPA